MSEYINIFNVILKRDLMLAFRDKTDFINSLIFFIIVITLFPLTFGTKSTIVNEIIPGMIWISALLATCLSLETIFRSDFEDGSIEQLTLSRYPLTLLVSAKIFAHWITFGMPLIIISLLMGILLSLSNEIIIALFITLILGTPILSLLGSVMVALTIGLRGGMLLNLLILPLSMPVLIFSTVAIQNAALNQSIIAETYFLAGILVLAITLAPLATATALRIRLS
jgi:heme exporter protein B|tara:strand:- start:721 stop:1395 length:675 start_codon:yes stop_codon:yes gene_type:complete